MEEQTSRQTSKPPSGQPQLLSYTHSITAYHSHQRHTISMSRHGISTAKPASQRKPCSLQNQHTGSSYLFCNYTLALAIVQECGRHGIGKNVGKAFAHYYTMQCHSTCVHG